MKIEEPITWLDVKIIQNAKLRSIAEKLLSEGHKEDADYLVEFWKETAFLEKENEKLRILCFHTAHMMKASV